MVRRNRYEKEKELKHIITHMNPCAMDKTSKRKKIQNRSNYNKNKIHAKQMYMYSDECGIKISQ